MGIKEILDSLGGEDDQVQEAGDQPYFNKAHHLLRSAAHNSKHIKHLSVLAPAPECPDRKTRGLIQSWAAANMPISDPDN